MREGCNGIDPGDRRAVWRVLRGVLPVLMTLLLVRAPAPAQVISDTSVFTTLSRAYSILRIDPHAALPYFRHAADLDSLNLQAHQMLGYLYYQNEHEYERALTEFTIALRLQPSDTMQYLRACVLHALRRDSEAVPLFERLKKSPSADISAKADDELRSLAPPVGAMSSHAGGSGWWTRLYADLYYDSRWTDNFLNLTAEEGYNLFPFLSLYGAYAVSGDTRSSTGAVPEIFADNTEMLSIGLRTAPWAGFSVSAQEGVSFDVIGRTDVPIVQNDFRLYAVYGYGIYAPFSRHPGIRFPMIPTFDLYTSAGAYSRYKNTIGYLQVKGGLRALEASGTVVDCFLQLNGAHDAAIDIFRSDPSVAAKEYYNNIVEWGGGIRVAPEVDWGIYLLAEAFRGSYTNISLLPAGRDRYYNSVRLSLIVDRMFIR